MIGDDQLIRFVGAWIGDEELFATAWTAAGTARATLTLSPAPGGGLLLDYAAAAIQGHGVIRDDGWWWFDSYGFTPDRPGSAHVDGDTLVLERVSPRGRTVTTLRRDGDLLEQRIETAVPADAQLAPLMVGRYAPAPTG